MSSTVTASGGLQAEATNLVLAGAASPVSSRTAVAPLAGGGGGGNVVDAGNGADDTVGAVVAGDASGGGNSLRGGVAVESNVRDRLDYHFVASLGIWQVLGGVSGIIAVVSTSQWQRYFLSIIKI